ncbi:glycosyltransferase family 4 protein [Sutcliffiella horikoshii]|uniref:glycosyltransferase family 4 protein n=1 Tax=Sutcliffiella horikoshii TaxID=79883 RepID=UPI00203CEBCF|nr:glycosyltransferase family 4 protein [Sutcliffiella horikoshii]MCM3617922.1 glycosyltransferase family 4 protein [Sutcliffiella horikoshii]
MKIVHVCLAGSYNDNWSYQDNIIPKYHKKNGHEVTVITSTFINSKEHSGYERVNPGEYTLDNGLKIIRIPFRKFPFQRAVEKLRLYQGLYLKLVQEKPDFLFIHGLQFIDMSHIVKYLKHNRSVKVVVDNHADFSNSARNWLSKNILHRIIWRYCANLIEPFTKKFYGVLPARVDFLVDVYNVPKEKVDLLVMGADDEKVCEAKKLSTLEEIRNKHGIDSSDFLIITGGKIDYAKRQTLMLMEAVKKIDRDKIKLIVFGPIVKEMRNKVESYVDEKRIIYIEWLESDDSYKYFGAADLAVFPGRHSVYWEQVAGLGVPMVVKYWEGTTHIDVGGNCKFLHKDSTEEIIETILNIVNNPEIHSEMKKVSERVGMGKFSYEKISKSSITI